MPLTVRDVMTTDVQTVTPKMTLTEMDRLLISHELNGAPVVEGETLVGIISRADVVRVLYDQQMKAERVSGFYTSPFPIPIPALEKLASDSRRIVDHMTKLRVEDVMTRAPQTVSPEDELGAVAELMCKEGFHRVPVVDGERLVGIATSLDLVRAIAEVGLAER